LVGAIFLQKYLNLFLLMNFFTDKLQNTLGITALFSLKVLIGRRVWDLDVGLGVLFGAGALEVKLFVY